MSAFINALSVRFRVFGLGGVSRVWLSFTRTNRSRCGGKVGISRVGRDSQGGVGSGGNLRLVFAGFHTSGFSTALLFAKFREWPLLVIEPPDNVRSVA